MKKKYLRVYNAIWGRILEHILIPMTYRYMKRYKIMNSIDTINYIIENKFSISRYGDGEFGIIFGRSSTFQDYDENLAIKLKEILCQDTSIYSHIVCVPYSLKDYSIHGGTLNWWQYYTFSHVRELRTLLNSESIYGDALLSRFYIDYNDKSHCKEHLETLKKIWDNQDILIIEGNRTYSGIGNDLYDNARSIKRIVGPANNAFSMYNEMLETIKKYASKNKLILLSYGMVATVLAYDLAQLGYWAIDIGHLDIEYEWFKMGAKSKIAIKGKFTNEVKDGKIVNICKDSNYIKQIICDITI